MEEIVALKDAYSEFINQRKFCFKRFITELNNINGKYFCKIPSGCNCNILECFEAIPLECYSNKKKLAMAIEDILQF